MISTRTANSISFFPTLRSNFFSCPATGMGRLARPSTSMLSIVENAGLIAGDLNNDKKLDFIWGNAVFLGNGDGTFKQIPLNPASPSASVIALADLNGDGILDAVYSPGTSIYAGNGDGTFQTTPFYTVPLPCTGGVCTSVDSFALGDVNGDGNPDLLLVESVSSSSPSLVLYLGDGHGNFTQDPNNYFVGTLNRRPSYYHAGPAEQPGSSSCKRQPARSFDDGMLMDNLRIRFRC